MTYIAAVSLAYDRLPMLDREAARAWRELADETKALYEGIELALDIVHTTKADPYPDAYSMLLDIANGRLKVSTAHCTHPLWTLEENIRFRVVHDVLGHGTTGAGFDWAGECAAYEKHASLTKSPRARLALFTEAIGQVAYHTHHGYFPPQKCAILPSYLQWSYHG